jgi:phage shock protein A
MTLLFEVLLIAIVGIVVLAILTKGRFFSAIANRSKAAAEDLTDAVRDPVADGKVAISAAKQELNELRNSRRELLVEISQQEAELKDLEAELTKWENIAVAAGKQGNTDNVRKALARKAEVQTDISQVNDFKNQYQKDADAMSKAISEREGEIQAAERDSKRLAKSIGFEKFRQSRAQDALGESNAAKSLAQLRKDAAAARARSDALETEARIGNEDQALEEQYLESSAAKVTDDDVARYLVAQS